MIGQSARPSVNLSGVGENLHLVIWPQLLRNTANMYKLKRKESSTNCCLIFFSQHGVEKSFAELFGILFLSTKVLYDSKLIVSCTACSSQRSASSENHKKCEDKRENVLLQSAYSSYTARQLVASYQCCFWQCLSVRVLILSSLFRVPGIWSELVF